MGECKSMTKEELEKEANKYADENATPDLDYSFRVDIFEASKEGYLAGAEPREKRIAELEAQIEKMKCCGNCQKLRGRFDSKTNINILYCSDPDMKQIEVGFQMCCCKWEIKEK